MTRRDMPRDHADNIEKGTAQTNVSAGDEKSRPLPPAARRALAEAEERRRRAANQAPTPEEIGGRGGLDPARYGDWEVKGLTSDF
jgi:hypothetical protein